jgi:anti-sigma regulatory factor (Ser/Thr protein kinase)
MGQLRTAVRMLAVLDPIPDEVLSHLDDLALSTAQVQLATCVYAVFDPVSRELSFATAGHLPPVLQDPDGKARFLDPPSGAPLGVGGVAYEAKTVTIPDGARLLLYTDGLVESRQSDIDEGLDALIGALGSGPADLEELCDHLLTTLRRDGAHDDDVALLLTSLHGLDPEHVHCWRLAAEGPQVGVARAHVRAALDAWGLPQLGDTAELLVSELVTNAVRHATGPIELQVLLLDEIVSFSVADAKTPLPRLRRTTFDDEGGRGLQLVSLLSHRWGARATVSGKVVWCDLRRPQRA